MEEATKQSISSLMEETRRFPPPPEFASKAYIKSFEQYQEMYKRSVEDPTGFWLDLAKSELSWFKEPTIARAYEWNSQTRTAWHRFFEDGELNASYNCLDRQLEKRGNKPAIIWQGEPDEDTAILTYAALHEKVCKFANVLKSKGVKKGDRVCIYLPMIPELPIAMLACARIGAVHSVVFGGFSADSLRDRILDSDCRVLITSDVSYRSGKRIGLKATGDTALQECPNVGTVIVVKRGDGNVPMQAGRDFWWHEEMDKASSECAPERMNAEDPLFILYTSGSTGKPKGALHTTAGYLLHCAFSHKVIFDVHEDDIYWCTADIGWVTGHSYIVYGPLCNGATSLMFEGVPTYPDAGRFWQVVDKFKVTIFYTAPTAIRSLMQQGVEWPAKHDLSTLRVLGTVGEPINPEAWMWYYENIGKRRCPIVDTRW